MPTRLASQQIKFDSETELHALMLLSIDGNARAYSDFLGRVSRILRAYLKKSVNQTRISSDQVEDLVQDVLLAIHQKRGTYRPDLPIMPWLFTIAKYKLIDSYRAQGRRPLILAFEDEIDPNEIAADASENELTSRMDIDTILASLSEKQRRVLMLAKVEELPLAKVGEKMNMSLSSVKVTIHRALATLKKNQKPGTDRDDI